ncbi:DUF4255 domain-containing protein [Chryseobacterium sp. PBS4-4]|uniref:DUF4255 domain-containing protein n=1 Tax=Chryseobacterium edaphi TaxID=2976532 RepID=A0ABT2W592_9FLAO|nr:DUF4255 domain-containing protein [Chryseobacterium edaphi]MCU7617371.1 DUF4255 domain-containing protein [Chryseobacterium edaphi]
MKISEILTKIADDINSKLQSQSAVVIANLAAISKDEEFLQLSSPIILSLVNIEEVRNLKNKTSPSYSSGITQNFSNLVFSVLFASPMIKSADYLEGIDALEEIIQYFKDKPIFQVQDSDLLINELNFNQKIAIEMISLSTEELHHMWSYLGCYYMPSVLYKVRMLPNESVNL